MVNGNKSKKNLQNNINRKYIVVGFFQKQTNKLNSENLLEV